MFWSTAWTATDLDVKSGQIRDRVRNLGQFSVPSDLVFFSGQALKIRDCSKKFGTDGHLSLSCSPIVSCILTVSLFLDDKGKGKGRALVIAPHSRHGHLRGDQVHGAHHAASHIPALYLPSRSWYSFTDPERMEGWVSPGPGCKEQLANGCYATACGRR